MEQWNWAKEIPAVLGGYFTARHLGNAWNRIYYGRMSVRDAIEQAVEDINKEMKAKREEYGIN
jgi:hypothetical protein